MTALRQIAFENVGIIDRQTEVSGHRRCPGDAMHSITTSNLQELFYLDAESEGESICRKPTRSEIHADCLAGFHHQTQEAIP